MITNKCDRNCKYCCNKQYDVNKIPIVTHDELVRAERLYLTGGEPFVRLGCTDLIRSIKMIDGIKEVTVTTNGQTLEKYVDELKEIGIDGINISLDTLDPERYAFITGRGELDKTIRSIERSVGAGIKTKINCLLQKGFNEDEIFDFAELAFRHGIDVRFIEMMPVGAADAGSGVSNTYVLQKLKDRWPDLEPDGSVHGNGPAVYYKRPGYEGGIGLISAIHGKFCGYCNRVRLTSQGQLKPCLSFDTGTDLMPALRGTDEELGEVLRRAVYEKPKAHSFGDTENNDAHAEHRLMSQIGG